VVVGQQLGSETSRRAVTAHHPDRDVLVDHDHRGKPRGSVVVFGAAAYDRIVVRHRVQGSLVG
jgi:hypothetical protein